MMYYYAVSLLLVLSCNCYYSPLVVVVHARESNFFHNTVSPDYPPAPAPGPATTAPVALVVENYGYGLYGSSDDSESNSNMVPPQKELITNNYKNDNNIDDEEEMLLSKELVNDEMMSSSLEKKDSAETHNNNNNNNNENDYEFDKYYYKRSVTNSNGGAGAYELGQAAGMSDTRYMDSGNYYYNDIKSDDHDLTNYANNNGYTSTSDDDETLDPQVYSYTTGSSYNNNDFNTMEQAEYYQSQGYHNTKEQEYVP